MVERKERTFSDIIEETNRRRTAPIVANKEKSIVRAAYNLVNKNPVGKFLRNATIVAVVGLGSAQITNSYNQMKNETNSTSIANHVLSENPLEQDIGKVLYTKKEVYLSLLSREPSNAEAQKELQKLDLLIAAYEQAYNSKLEVE